VSTGFAGAKTRRGERGSTLLFQVAALPVDPAQKTGAAFDPTVRATLILAA